MLELERMIRKNTEKKIEELSKKYNFDIKEAKRYMGYEEEKEEKRSSKIILPFCGKINEKCCEGVKLNYGLYTQCTNKKEDTEFCKICKKQGDKNGTGKPTYGTIKERLDAGKGFRDNKGKEAVRYANIMKKFDISREDAEKEATKLGLIIPEEEFMEKEVKRGRPKKNVEVSDTESESSIAKKRGRPKKEKPIVSELSPGDALIAGLMKEVKKEEPPQIVNPNINTEPNVDVVNDNDDNDDNDDDDDDDDDDDEEEIEVVKFVDPKTKIEYYKSMDNILYSMDSEPVGRWNPKTLSIDLLEIDSDDDE